MKTYSYRHSKEAKVELVVMADFDQRSRFCATEFDYYLVSHWLQAACPSRLDYILPR